MIAFLVDMIKELAKEWWLWLILLISWAAFHFAVIESKAPQKG